MLKEGTKGMRRLVPTDFPRLSGTIVSVALQYFSRFLQILMGVLALASRSHPHR